MNTSYENNKRTERYGRFLLTTVKYKSDVFHTEDEYITYTHDLKGDEGNVKGSHVRKTQVASVQAAKDYIDAGCKPAAISVYNSVTGELMNNNYVITFTDNAALNTFINVLQGMAEVDPQDCRQYAVHPETMANTKEVWDSMDKAVLAHKKG